MKLVVLGAGSWGTALAASVARRHDTLLWARDVQQASRMRESRRHPHYLPGVELPAELRVSADLAEALDHLEGDHEFLLKGDVFTRDFLEMWVSHKRKEHDALRLRPHPYEFFLYYDV